MGTKAGALLWRRMRIILPGGTLQLASVLDVDTGVTQLDKAFDDSSSGEPGFGTPSRIQVTPLSPIPRWNNVTHSEPVFNTTTETIHIVFTNAGFSPVTINVLIWDPHSIIGPGQADTYLSAGPPILT